MNYITIEKPSEDGTVIRHRYAVSEEVMETVGGLVADAEEVPVLPDTQGMMNTLLQSLPGMNRAIIYDMSEKPDSRSFEEVLAIYKSFNFVVADSKGKGTLNTRIGV